MEIDTEEQVIKMEHNGFVVEIDLKGVEHGVERIENKRDDEDFNSGEAITEMKEQVSRMIGVTIEPTDDKWDELA